MVDTHNYYVYENQRWNPVTGYTSHGLPTDRYMWSDASGRHKRTREHTKLLSMQWHWVRIYSNIFKFQYLNFFYLNSNDQFYNS